MHQTKVLASEYNEVVRVVAKYVEAIRTGNVDMLADVFHQDSVAFGTVNGELVGGGSGNPTADFIKTHGKSPEIDFHIDVLDITPTTAVVRIVTENDAVGSDCNENQLLVKLENGWKVVAKLFHQF